ncbi:MAG: hypothetical protein IJN69_01965 [Oscillospiraceae bacterium]|nr:hypothetical protein [Oscillospiraceae bacterium]
MSQLIDYMNEIGLNSIDKIKDYFSTSPLEEILALNAYASSLVINDWSLPEYSPYTFMPSSDVSGFGGCAEINCKIRRANKFNKYSALYGDNVFLITDTFSNPHIGFVSEPSEDYYRQLWINDYSLIFIYSNLIQSGIAKIIPHSLSICPDCFSKHIFNLKELDDLNPVIEKYAHKSILSIDDYFDTEDLAFLTLKNLPELFPEHTGCFSIQDFKSTKLYKNSQFGNKEGYGFKDRYDFIKEYITEEYKTYKLETFVSSVYHSKYITTKSSDKEIIDITSGNTIGYTPSPVFEMPFLANVDTNTILSLRNHEHSAFLDYRIAIDKASKEYLKSHSEIEAQEIYDDIIYPAFTNLDKMFKKVNNMKAVKRFGGLVVIPSTIALGVINSSIPNDITTIVETLAGSEALLGMIDKALERKTNLKSNFENQDFYFLWKLNKQAKK